MPAGGTWGIFFSLLTESFAVRALLGSLTAGVLGALIVRSGAVRGRRARRLLVVGPALVAAATCVAVAVEGEAYLPQLWITAATGGAAEQLLDFLGEWRFRHDVGLLVSVYGVVVGVLLTRRLVGAALCRRLLRRSVPARDADLLRTTDRIAAAFGIRTPRLRLLPGCPGGAFTARTLRPLIVVDPGVLDSLDPREREALVAHEMAHVARRDPLVGLAVGLVRDLAFFVPPVHLAARWLIREREESADELAVSQTRRPGALASSIVKIWDARRDRGRVAVACAAVPNGRLALSTAGRGASPAAVMLTARVERLLEPALAPGLARRLLELPLALVAVALATAVALVVPGWVAADYNAYSLSIGYLAAPLAEPVESPAFATFRALAPERRPVRDDARAITSGAPATAVMASPGCPCVESQAQLAQGVAASVPGAAPRMLWRSADHDPWEVRGPRAGQEVRSARPLWTLSDNGPQVGFFVVGRPGG